MSCVRVVSLPVEERHYTHSQEHKIWTQQALLLSFVLTLSVVFCGMQPWSTAHLDSSEKYWTWQMLFQVAPKSPISWFAFDGVSAGSNSVKSSLLSPKSFSCAGVLYGLKTSALAKALPHSPFYLFSSCQDDTSGDYKTALLNLCGSDWLNLGWSCWYGCSKKINSEQVFENVYTENLSIDPRGEKKKIKLIVKISKAPWKMWMHMKSYSFPNSFSNRNGNVSFIVPILFHAIPLLFQHRVILECEIKGSLNPLSVFCKSERPCKSWAALKPC